MPLPTPIAGESQDTFIERCMSDEVLKKEFSDRKQRLAVCFSRWKNKRKESSFSKVGGYEFKTADSGDLIVKGFIATTHVDDGFYDGDRGLYVKDKISKETLEEWAKQINEGSPKSNKVSVNHKREPHVVGVGIKGTASVELLPDNNYGLYVETLVDKTREDFSDVKYRIENDLLDSYSIEFTTRDPLTGEYYDGAVNESAVGSGVIRTLLPGTQLEGWTLASQPMNHFAVMIKEVFMQKANCEENKMEVNTMPEVKKEIKVEVPTLSMPETKEAKEVKPKVESISEEDKELLAKIKEMKAKELKGAEFKEITEQVLKEVKINLDKIEVENKVKVNKDLEHQFTEFKEAYDPTSNMTVEGKMKLAIRFAEKKGLISENGFKPITRRSKAIEGFGIRNFSTKERRCIGLEFKSLGVATNQNSDTDYLLSAAELSDVFDPIIYNLLNQTTVTWNILAKDDFSNKGNNLVQFTAKYAANTSATAYTGNAVSTGNVSRLKFQTKFKKYSVGVEVDGDIIAAARGGPIGDVFAQEVKDSTDDLMAVMNAALFAEVGLETATGVIGFEYITDSAGNGTLYNLTRSSAAGGLLNPSSATDTYINASSADISLGNLRAAKRQALKEGASIGNLVFVTDYIQGDKFRGKYDAIQRTVPTSSRFGFEGRPEFDGIPIFEDKDCADDDWWLIDLETHRIAIWVPPTLEMLGKSGDSQSAFIKTYWCTYNRAPRRMVQIYGCATT